MLLHRLRPLASSLPTVASSRTCSWPLISTPPRSRAALRLWSAQTARHVMSSCSPSGSSPRHLHDAHPRVLMYRRRSGALTYIVPEYTCGEVCIRQLISYLVGALLPFSLAYLPFVKPCARSARSSPDGACTAVHIYACAHMAITVVWDMLTMYLGCGCHAWAWAAVTIVLTVLLRVLPVH